MTSDIYIYVPSVLSQRSNTLTKDNAFHAHLKIKRFASYVTYKSNFAQLEIIKNRFFRPKSYNIFQHPNSENPLAIYTFSSLRDLPVGEIQFLTGNTYFVKKHADKSYNVFCGDEMIASLDTNTSKNCLKQPSLVIKMKSATSNNILEYEVILFSVWFFMITVGMGLNDG